MRAALNVSIDRDWTDWVLVAGAVVTAAATVGAVLVALFGSQWADRRKRPRLHVRADPAEQWFPLDGAELELMRLRLENEPGRHTAADVEVFVSIKAPALPGEDCEYFLVTEGENLNFDDPRKGAERTSATVPAGFSRFVNVAAIGPPQSYRPPGKQVWPDEWGYVAICPLDLALRRSTVHLGRKHETRIVVTGSNFDAVRFVGTFTLTDKDWDEDGRVTPMRVFEWIDEPQRE